MIDFLKENVDWIFGGFGVALVSAIFRAVRRHFRRLRRSVLEAGGFSPAERGGAPPPRSSELSTEDLLAVFGTHGSVLHTKLLGLIRVFLASRDQGRRLLEAARAENLADDLEDFLLAAFLKDCGFDTERLDAAIESTRDLTNEQIRERVRRFAASALDPERNSLHARYLRLAPSVEAARLALAREEDDARKETRRWVEGLLASTDADPLHERLRERVDEFAGASTLADARERALLTISGFVKTNSAIFGQSREELLERCASMPLEDFKDMVEMATRRWVA